MRPIQAPSPFSFLENVTLSKADVAQLKTTVDTFAASYTSGADAAKDKAALSALQTGLQALLANIWSETHVVSKDALTKLQQSVDSFVAGYTSGTNVAQDTSAWAALRSGLSDFWTSVNSSGGTTNPMPIPLPPVAMPMTSATASVSASGTGMMTPANASTSVSGTGMITSGAASTSLSGGGAGTVATGTASTDFMLGQTTISKDDVTKIQQAIDAFAAAYTSGTDPAADKTAVSNLESSLSGLAQNWQSTMPMPVPMPVPLPPSPAAPPAGVVVTTQAGATPPAGAVVTAPAAPPPGVVVTAPPAPAPPILPPGAFVSMPMSAVAGWVPGFGRPLGAPIILGR
jgi:hypothetical protein